jgi:ribonuclease VapC
VVPPGVAEWDAADAVFAAFDKGCGHLAGLRVGDVLSDALAKVRGLPLLFKGDDFSKTDLRCARVD